MPEKTSTCSDGAPSCVGPLEERVVASVTTPSRPEILAPAGDWECVRAAVENGADAVYFGVDAFNARMRARNFTRQDLPALMEFLHRRGVRGYLTFNTLVFQDELPFAEEVLRTAISAGVDAAIVQDVGICRLIRAISPDFPIHGSTQMTIASPAGARLARELGCSLVVLARENTLEEIAKIRKQMAEDPLPLEVFVHGALCVAYSGQCLTSEALGGRSANRGECAQACRMPYDLLSDGHEVDLGNRRYLLSPRDLAGLELVPRLVDLGIRSFKIEGRLKQPEYVASITRLYRQAVDRAMASRSTGVPAPPPSPDDRYEMEMAFSRGLHTGWMAGIDNQTLVHAQYPKKRGVWCATVVVVRSYEVLVELREHLAPGDGVVFEAANLESREEGGRVWEVEEEAGRTVLRFADGGIDFRKLLPGQRVFKTSDPRLEKAIRRTWEKESFERPVRALVEGEPGGPLRLELSDEQGRIASGTSRILLEPARSKALDAEYLQGQIGRLGGTTLRLEALVSRVGPGLALPASELNRLRREVVEDLLQQRACPPRWSIRSPIRESDPTPRTVSGNATLSVLVRGFDQIDAAVASGVDRLLLDFEHLKQLPQAVARYRAQSAGEVWIAPPRVGKVGEEWILRQVEAAGADGILARNWDHLLWFSGRTRLAGDFSLNIANAPSARWFLERFGLEHVTASADLTAQQVVDLAQGGDPARLEVVIHQHMPMFHMEHCVFCAFLSKGKDFRDCGRPCEAHEVRLRDHLGASHPVKADAGCRNTVFNARAQTGAEFHERFRAAGLGRFRLEFLDEDAAEVRRVIGLYRDLLSGNQAGTGLWKDLKALNQLGVTRGTLEVRRGEVHG
ncbi:MAG: U32 family peptidase [Fibrobacteria bacterium]|nr:U32 family peptidase [Fibrobacteria bacterium]